MVYAIILSGGIGTRFGNQLPKQFLKINNKTILEYSIETFETHNLINKIIIVSNPNFIEETKEILAKNNYKKFVLSFLAETREENLHIED